MAATEEQAVTQVRVLFIVPEATGVMAGMVATEGMEAMADRLQSFANIAPMCAPLSETKSA